MLSRLFRRRGPAKVYLELRGAALALKPGDLPAEVRGAPVVALVMDMGVANGVATLVCIADGTTSLYFGSGGGVIGAGEHEPIQGKARRALEAARHNASLLSAATDVPLPKPGVMVMTVVTAGGLRSGSARVEELQAGHRLTALFRAADEVVTAMREFMERRGG